MKHLITLMLVTLIGCAQMTKQGDITTTEISMPDGATVSTVDHVRWGLFTPSTQRSWVYIKDSVDDEYVKALSPNTITQKGVGNTIVEKVIEGGAFAGGMYLLGGGISDSGDDNNFSNDSESTTKQQQGQFQGQKNSLKNINKNSRKRSGWKNKH